MDVAKCGQALSGMPFRAPNSEAIMSTRSDSVTNLQSRRWVASRANSSCRQAVSPETLMNAIM
jgi:hypothetical protein